MKKWIKDSLIGWAGAFVVAFFTFGVLIGGVGFLASGYEDPSGYSISTGLSWGLISSALIGFLPGFLGGWLGGKFLKFRWGNVVGGTGLILIPYLIIRLVAFLKGY